MVHKYILYKLKDPYLEKKYKKKIKNLLVILCESAEID